MADRTFTGKWHQYPERKPEDDGKYLITVENSYYNSTYIDIDRYFDIGNAWLKYRGQENLIKAWAELPKPYERNTKWTR